eukprot:COSAG02_NODE_3911_length_6054_cov_3.034593_2_plen_421_part_00
MLSRRAARVSERAAMAAVLSTGSPHRALQQCRANHVRHGVRRVEETLEQQAKLLGTCPTAVQQMVRSCGGQQAAEGLAALAAAGQRLPKLEKEAAALRTRCAELEIELEAERRRRTEATDALESHAAQMVEQVGRTHANHAVQLERHRSEHEAEVLARQEGWEQAASEHEDEVRKLREQWDRTAQRHAQEIKQLHGARETALAHAKVADEQRMAAEEQRVAQAAALSHHEEVVRQKWSALERTNAGIQAALQAVEHAEAAQTQAEAEKTAVEVQLRSEREARQRAEAREQDALAAAAASAEQRANDRTAASDKAKRLQKSTNTIARQLVAIRAVQTSLRQQVQVLQVALTTFAKPIGLAVADHFKFTAESVAAEAHAVRDVQAVEAEQEQLETMRLLIDAVRAEAQAASSTEDTRQAAVP